MKKHYFLKICEVKTISSISGHWYLSIFMTTCCSQRIQYILSSQDIMEKAKSMLYRHFQQYCSNSILQVHSMRRIIRPFPPNKLFCFILRLTLPICYLSEWHFAFLIYDSPIMDLTQELFLEIQIVFISSKILTLLNTLVHYSQLAQNHCYALIQVLPYFNKVQLESLVY